MDTFYDLSIQFILFLQSLGQWLIAIMGFFSFLGTQWFMLLFMPALYWCFDVGLGLRVGIILLTSSSLNAILKMAFHTPRPFWYSDQVKAYTLETTFGVPSGHAQNAAAVWGMVAVHSRRWWIWVIASILIFLIGFSRLVLGVHFPTDVLSGWLIGFILLWLFIRLEKPVMAWLLRQNLAERLLVVFAASIALIGLGVLVKSSLADWQMPEVWRENFFKAFPNVDEFDPFDLSGLISTAGVLFGFAGGALWLFAGGGFDPSGPWGKRLLRYVIGLLGLAVLFFGLAAVLPGGKDLLGFAMRYLRYFLIGVWASALAPMLFIRLGLASSPQK